MTSPIRPLERDDLPAVANLYEEIVRSGGHVAPPGLADYFEQTFVLHPWADPEVPSLVYLDSDKRIVGFIGSHVRRLRFGDRRVLAGCSGQLVTTLEARQRAAGIFLMRAYMAGPQELTFTDTASDEVRRMWRSLGGEVSQIACVGWVRVLRPGHFAAGELSRRRRLERVTRVAEPIWSLVDRASVRVARSALEPPLPSTTTEPLTAPLMAGHLADVASSFSVRPEYEDEAFVNWLFAALAQPAIRGRLIARLVRAATGSVLGWYVYYHRPRQIAQVLQIAAGERAAGEVLDALFHDARSRGATAVQGRVEGHLFNALGERGCLFHRSGYLALIHGNDSDLLHAIQSGRALLTRMEGDWWNGHHLEGSDSAPPGIGA